MSGLSEGEQRVIEEYAALEAENAELRARLQQVNTSHQEDMDALMEQVYRAERRAKEEFEAGRQAGLREGIFRLRSQLSADRVYEESFPLLSETRTRIANGCSAIEVAIKNLELLTATDATTPGEGD